MYVIYLYVSLSSQSLRCPNLEMEKIFAKPSMKVGYKCNNNDLWLKNHNIWRYKVLEEHYHKICY